MSDINLPPRTSTDSPLVQQTRAIGQQISDAHERVATLEQATQAIPWLPYVPDISSVNETGVIARCQVLPGRTAVAQVQFTLDAAPTGFVYVSVPYTAQPIYATSGLGVVGTATGVRFGVSWNVGAVVFVSPDHVQIVSHGGGTPWQAGVPVTWASGDVWSLSFMYEMA